MPDSRCYDRAVLKLRGSEAETNFPRVEYAEVRGKSRRQFTLRCAYKDVDVDAGCRLERSQAAHSPAPVCSWLGEQQAQAPLISPPSSRPPLQDEFLLAHERTERDRFLDLLRQRFALKVSGRLGVSFCACTAL